MNGLLPREALTAAQRDDMFALLDAHFEGVTRERFERDLLEKNWVVEIRRAGRLLGFSTLLVREARHDGHALTAVYSGDTIVAPEAWGSPALARAWIAAVSQLREDCPDRPCHWLLLASGFRTYRFLPVFWREFHPRHNAPMPPDARRLMTELAGAQYGGAYDASAGIVRFPEPQRLRAPLAGVAPGRRTNPHVSFFLERNPGHARGDELVCLAELSEANLTRAGRRMVEA